MTVRSRNIGGNHQPDSIVIISRVARHNGGGNRNLPASGKALLACQRRPSRGGSGEKLKLSERQ